jgi:N-methylhydantoinase B
MPAEPQLVTVVPQERTAFDPVTLEVLWNRLLSVANEQQAALMRTAFSTVVRESQDLACGVFDTRGQMMAQSLTGTPGHINPMATGVRHLLAAYPPETLGPGDVLITNDPWMTSGQLNDFTVLTPIYREGRLVAYFGNLCHAADIGGQVFSGEAHEIYEEGLRVPVTKLFDRGEPNHELLKIIRANVRLPDETVGDLYAQAACNDVGGRALLAMMDEFGLESIDPLSDEIIARSERALRDAIRALPDGVYTHEVWSDGFEEPIKIAVTLTVRDDEIDIDFAGSSPQSRRGINVVLNYTRAYTTYGVKCAVAPHVPNNAGSFRPVTITAPEGCILNVTRPAPVAARHTVGLLLPDAVMGALSLAIPDRVIAQGSSCIWTVDMRGRTEAGDTFAYSFFTIGGTGARGAKDGMSVTQFPSTIRGVPVEVVEAVSPLVIHRKRIAPDTGGPGRHRGGCGVDLEIGVRTREDVLYSSVYEHVRVPPRGLFGGAPGAPGRLGLADGRTLPAKAKHWLKPGDRVTLRTPGGGGIGDPSTRDPAAVADDVVRGLVSPASAERDYRVVVDARGRLDAPATERLRAAR